MAAIDIQHIKTDGYLLSVGRHCLADLAEVLSGEQFAEAKVFILCDENTLQHCLPTAVMRISTFREAEVLEIPAGEESKSVEVCTHLWKALGDLHADRHSVLINLGGGVVTDLGGFIAGTFKRGIRFFNIPTSLLGQIDASVGGKVGIDLDGIKNEIGLFNKPNGVYVDPAFLTTLPRKQLISGFAEMIKHALIFSQDYWAEIKELSLLDLEGLDKHILTSISIKNEIVCSDPFEMGRRRILNFGHTIGHAVESLSFEGDMKDVLHGEAIALGMVCEAFISHRSGLLREEQLKDITSFIFSYFPHVPIDPLHFHRLVELMRHDKKNKGGKILMSLLDGIGDCIPGREVSADAVIESLHYYERWVG